MGRIKSALIKKTAKKLVSENPSLFSTDFEKNKRILYAAIPNKRSRNIITGYITKLMKK
jgi:ribosomal protein S17E